MQVKSFFLKHLIAGSRLLAYRQTTSDNSVPLDRPLDSVTSGSILNKPDFIPPADGLEGRVVAGGIVVREVHVSLS